MLPIIRYPKPKGGRMLEMEGPWDFDEVKAIVGDVTEPTKDAGSFEEEVKAIISTHNPTVREIEEIFRRCLKFKWKDYKHMWDRDVPVSDRGDQLDAVFIAIKAAFPKIHRLAENPFHQTGNLSDYMEIMETVFLQHSAMTPDQDSYSSLLCHAVVTGL